MDQINAERVSRSKLVWGGGSKEKGGGGQNVNSIPNNLYTGTRLENLQYIFTPAHI